MKYLKNYNIKELWQIEINSIESSHKDEESGEYITWEMNEENQELDLEKREL